MRENAGVNTKCEHFLLHPLPRLLHGVPSRRFTAHGSGWGSSCALFTAGGQGDKTYSLRTLERNKAQAGNAFGVTAISPPAPPAHPTGGGGTFCVRLGMYVSPRVKILGGVGVQRPTHPSAGTRVRCTWQGPAIGRPLCNRVSGFGD